MSAKKTVEQTAMVMAKSRPISLRVLKRDGTQATITGIDRRNGEMIGADTKDSYDLRVFLLYPNVPGLAPMLEELRVTRKRLQAKEERLSGVGFRFRATRMYGGTVEPRELVEGLDRLEQLYLERHELAVKLVSEGWEQEQESVEVNEERSSV
tara:strand:+ start:256 stop:714 length:459 start_codon:yes stop_codon:yes gene_type:complete